jgi:hypothetical protein
MLFGEAIRENCRLRTIESQAGNETHSKAVLAVLWMPQLIDDLQGGTMANFAEVLKELQQQRSRLDQAIRAIEELVG